MSPDREYSRRRFPTGAVAGVSVGITGCSGGSGGTPTASFDTPFERDVDPARTYLRTQSDDAGDARPVDLASIGLRPGTTVVLERRGLCTGSSGGTGMTGLFSADGTLESADVRERVVGAIDAGDDYQTSPTDEGGVETDIPEVFLVADNEDDQTSVTVTVPDGATHLFVAAIDNFYQDNARGETRFELRIETPE